MTTPLFAIPDSTISSESKKRSQHARDQSTDKFPFLPPKMFGDSPNESVSSPTFVENDDEEEVPLENYLQAATRRSRAQAHVQQRLQSLQYEEWTRFNDSFFSQSSNVDGDTFTPEIEGLGIICPLDWHLWRTTQRYDIIDRRWLCEINPAVFNEFGVLRDELLHVERPESVPWLYWMWLRGVFVDADAWAEGWVDGKPSLLWLERWSLGVLSRREMRGENRIGFLVGAEDENFVDERVSGDTVELTFLVY